MIPLITWESLKILFWIIIFLRIIISIVTLRISSLAVSKSLMASLILFFISISLGFWIFLIKLNCLLFGMNLRSNSSNNEGELFLLNSACWYFVSFENLFNIIISQTYGLIHYFKVSMSKFWNGIFNKKFECLIQYFPMWFDNLLGMSMKEFFKISLK